VNSFQELKLPQVLEKALQKIDFKTPTPIQAQAIPLAFDRKDLIACAQTGTGKTAAFCIPIAVRLLEIPTATALVLAPTRELALQIEAFWHELTSLSPELRAVCIIGGTSFKAQLKGLSRKPRMIIATPGRLLDHLKSRAAELNRTAILVLDEADRMLDMGFAPQLNQVLRYLPNARQTLLFSATWEPSLDALSKKYLKAPERITIGAISRAAATIEQKLVSTTVAAKNETLLDEINKRPGSMLIFARTQKRTDRLAKFLDSYGLEVGRLHGGRSQGQRTSALLAFREGRMRILVATDIAARGIDVTEIAHVINYDLPQVPEDYVHRIGRTGRAGMVGEALSILTSEDRPQWAEIVKLLKKSGSAVPTVPGMSLPGGAVFEPRQRPQQGGQRPQHAQNQRGGQRPHPLREPGARSNGQRRSWGKPQRGSGGGSGRPQGRPGGRSGRGSGTRSDASMGM
jgi:superfamily II DNA/RNA helicase